MNTRLTSTVVSCFAVIGAIVALYTLLGLLSAFVTTLLLGIPLLCLPAGFAAAAMVILTRRLAVPAIWIGALISGISVFLADGFQVLDLAIAAGIATGTLLQALAAAFLQHRFALFWPKTPQRGWSLVGMGLKALCAASFISLIDATLGMSVLALSGQIPAATYILMWSSAWLGNMLGILLIMPLLIWLGIRLRSWPVPRQTALVVLDIGLILAIGLFFILWSEETTRITNEFIDNASIAALILHTAVDQSQDNMEVLHTTYAVLNQRVTRAEFRAFVQMHLKDTGVQALIWAPIVPDTSRALFEASLQREGFPDFMISEQNANQQLIRAGARTEYVVANYSEPISLNQATIGFDFNSEPILQAALEQSRDSGQPTATEPTQLINTVASGFMIFWPVYAPDARIDTVAGRRAAIQGYLIGAFRIHDLMKLAMEEPEFHDIDAYLFDQHSAAGDQPFHIHQASSRLQTIMTNENPWFNQLPSTPAYSTSFDVAERSWRFVARPAPAFIAQRHTWVPWAALLTGIVTSTWVAFALAKRQEDAEALRYSEQRFRALIEKSANSIALVNSAGNVIYNSPNYAHNLGYSQDSHAGIHVLQKIHPDDLLHVNNTLHEIMQTAGLSRTSVFRAQHMDGSWRWLESTGTNLLGDPAVNAIVANMRDITDRKLAEEALLESEQRLRTILQTALDGFWIVDQQQCFIDVNEAYCSMSGYSRSELLTLRIADIEAIETEETINDRIRQIVTTGIGTFESSHRHKNGSTFAVDVSIHYIDSAGGQLVCFCRDISERKRREAEIHQLNSELELRVEQRTADLLLVNGELNRALRAKDEFLAIMSHELRTPLSSILAFSELLIAQEAGPLNERQVRSIQHIDTSGQHLLSLINDILDLSKIEAGRMEIYLEVGLISDICDASMRFIKELAIKKGLQVSFSSNDNRAIMEMDAKRLKQMLVNLLSNAVKFTLPGGQVALEVATDRVQQIVRFTVKDTGVGIAAEDIHRLFAPFTQLDSSLTRQHEGTGLGLALVKRLADQLNGTVQIESAGLGQGSSFILTLPWHKPQLDLHSIQASTTLIHDQLSLEMPLDYDPTGALILLVEDNAVTIALLSDYLHDQRYRVVVAHNGIEALALAAETQPALILMDIQMPVMDGLETMGHLRAQAAFATTPIVALTAMAIAGDRERCLAAGANEYVSKPIRLRGLSAIMKKLLIADALT